MSFQFFFNGLIFKCIWSCSSIWGFTVAEDRGYWSAIVLSCLVETMRNAVVGGCNSHFFCTWFLLEVLFKSYWWVLLKCWANPGLPNVLLLCGSGESWHLSLPGALVSWLSPSSFTLGLWPVSWTCKLCLPADNSHSISQQSHFPLCFGNPKTHGHSSTDRISSHHLPPGPAPPSAAAQPAEASVRAWPAHPGSSAPLAGWKAVFANSTASEYT